MSKDSSQNNLSAASGATEVVIDANAHEGIPENVNDLIEGQDPQQNFSRTNWSIVIIEGASWSVAGILVAWELGKLSIQSSEYQFLNELILYSSTAIGAVGLPLIGATISAASDCLSSVPNFPYFPLTIGTRFTYRLLKNKLFSPDTPVKLAQIQKPLVIANNKVPLPYTQYGTVQFSNSINTNSSPVYTKKNEVPEPVDPPQKIDNDANNFLWAIGKPRMTIIKNKQKYYQHFEESLKKDKGNDLFRLYKTYLDIQMDLIKHISNIKIPFVHKEALLNTIDRLEKHIADQNLIIHTKQSLKEQSANYYAEILNNLNIIHDELVIKIFYFKKEIIQRLSLMKGSLDTAVRQYNNLTPTAKILIIKGFNSQVGHHLLPIELNWLQFVDSTNASLNNQERRSQAADWESDLLNNQEVSDPILTMITGDNTPVKIDQSSFIIMNESVQSQLTDISAEENYWKALIKAQQQELDFHNSQIELMKLIKENLTKNQQTLTRWKKFLRIYQLSLQDYFQQFFNQAAEHFIIIKEGIKKNILQNSNQFKDFFEQNINTFIKLQSGQLMNTMNYLENFLSSHASQVDLACNEELKKHLTHAHNIFKGLKDQFKADENISGKINYHLNNLQQILSLVITNPVNHIQEIFSFMQMNQLSFSEVQQSSLEYNLNKFKEDPSLIARDEYLLNNLFKQLIELTETLQLSKQLRTYHQFFESYNFNYLKKISNATKLCQQLVENLSTYDHNSQDLELIIDLLKRILEDKNQFGERPQIVIDGLKSFQCLWPERLKNAQVFLRKLLKQSLEVITDPCNPIISQEIIEFDKLLNSLVNNLFQYNSEVLPYFVDHFYNYLSGLKLGLSGEPLFDEGRILIKEWQFINKQNETKFPDLECTLAKVLLIENFARREFIKQFKKGFSLEIAIRNCQNWFFQSQEGFFNRWVSEYNIEIYFKNFDKKQIKIQEVVETQPGTVISKATANSPQMLFNKGVGRKPVDTNTGGFSYKR